MESKIAKFRKRAPRVNKTNALTQTHVFLNVLSLKYVLMTDFQASTEYIELFSYMDGPDRAPVGHYRSWEGTGIEVSHQSSTLAS